MKIVTWNVNSVRARLERLEAWLASRAPDVVCLQETKVIDADFPREAIEAQGYHAAIYGQKTYNGVAILSRTPATDVLVGFADGEPEDDARVIAATVEGIRVIGVYVPNGKEVGTDKYAYKLAWFARLRAYLERHCDPTVPTLLCGDFNVAPDDRDVWDPDGWRDQILCSTPERESLARVVEWGLTDTFRHLNDEGGIFTWWDYRQLGFPKNRGLRIDHIYVTPPLLARLEDCKVDREERKGKQPSDHAPLCATFR